MKQFLLVVLALFSTGIEGQVLQTLVYGPIPGYTDVPAAGEFIIKSTYTNRKSTSIYNGDGEVITYNKLEDGDADPERFYSMLYLTTVYSINEKLSISIMFPFVLDQGVRFDNVNPAWTGYYQDTSGENGLGDISVSAYLLLLSNSYSRLMGYSSYKSSSGGDPYDIKENAYSSTGTGQSDIDIGAQADFALSPNILFSSGAAFIIRNEGSYSTEGYSWNEKPGNEIAFWGALSFHPSDIFALGIATSFFSASEDEFDGESIENSDVNRLSLTPKIGYKLSAGETIMHILGSYSLPIKGKSISKYSGYRLSIYMYL